MSKEEDKVDDEDLKNERKKLDELGLKSTWSILTELSKKKKEEN
jgi:hypothetical protein